MMPSMEELNLNQNLRWRQARVFSCKKRFIIVVAGRRWGKTRLALWWLVVNAFSGQNRLCYYIAPNYRQAKRIAWGVLKKLVPIGARCHTSEQELSIKLANGSVIELHGAGRPDSISTGFTGFPSGARDANLKATKFSHGQCFKLRQS